MRSFEFARKIVNGEKTEEKAFEDARLPVYGTKYSAGADFFAAEDVIVPSIWRLAIACVLNRFKNETETASIEPVLVHTGVKADMYEDEVLELYNRSSNPKKLGLVLANSVGVIDRDYYNNPSNDGDIMFAFYNFKPWDTKIAKGTRIGQGVFKKFLRPEKGLFVENETRSGGFGSTGK